MTRHLTLDRDALRLEGLLDGPDHAPLVMLVHGFPDTPHGWDALVPGLLAAGFRAFRPWLRGYTRDSAFAEARYDLLAVGDDLNAWRQHLGVSRAHLVGHDWGAIAAMVAAGDDPQGWHGTSLLAIPPLQRPERGWRLLPAQLWQSSYMLFLQSEAAPVLIRQGGCAYLRRLWRQWSPGWDFSDAQFAPVQTAFAQPAVARAATRYYRSLFTLHKAATRDFLMALRRPLRQPVLALAGAQDGCMQAGLLDALIDPRLFPAGIRHAVLPGCGHFLQAERPQAVLDELLPHLQATTA